MSEKKKNILFYILVGLMIAMGFLMRYIAGKIDFKRKYGMPKEEFVNTVGRMGVQDFKDSMNNYLGRKITRADITDVPQLNWVKVILKKSMSGSITNVEGNPMNFGDLFEDNSEDVPEFDILMDEISHLSEVEQYNIIISKPSYSGQLQKDIDWMLLQDGADSIEKDNLISAMNVKLLENFGLTLSDPATKKEMKKAMNTFLKRNQ